ncbi:MAG: archaeosine biosynthesis radical SAM protein RaSEA [Candidatus Heimdallarchaeota archaeon]|nr:MAG: archaeosine biosynthesis radical SAM protein RaSEA [Candidatus Heimdallarchaeota archaeon]
MSLPRNPLLSSTIYKLRQEFLELEKDSLKPKTWFKLTETMEKVVITGVIPTRGCSWALSETGGCSVCGYINDSSRDHKIPSEQIIEHIQQSLNQANPSKPIEFKLFNSGSFFDEDDIPQKLRSQIIDLLKKPNKIRLFSVESRPEYLLNHQDIINETNIRLKPITLEIGVGMESSNDAILRDCWNKGFLLDDYRESVQITRLNGIRIKTYVLIKPPFLTELEAICDSIRTSIDAIEIGTDIISFNPCTVQNGTLVNFLAKKNRFSPPWLWSVLHVIKTIRNQFPEQELICEPIAAGKQRGPHNCGKCDKNVLDLINRVINSKQIPNDLSNICPCYKRWQVLVTTPIEVFRTRNHSKLRFLNPLNE